MLSKRKFVVLKDSFFDKLFNNIFVNFQVTKMKCQVDKNKHLQYLFFLVKLLKLSLTIFFTVLCKYQFLLFIAMF